MYHNLGCRLIENFNNNYKGKNEIYYFIFTDKEPKLNDINNVNYIHTIHNNWLEGTNSKFKNFISIKEKFNEIPIDYVYYMDADTNVKKPFTDDILLGDLVGAEHFGNESSEIKAYDRNPNSKAYIPYDTPYEQIYYQGAFFGGRTNNVLNMCKELINYQEQDKLNNYEPIWNDESYLNKYLHYNTHKTIWYKDFPFIVSDKGGMGDMRHYVKENFESNNQNKNYLNLIFIILIIFIILFFLYIINI